MRQSIEGGTAKNVIIFLGDGMGDSENTIARNYPVGAAGRLSMDTLPLTGEYTTQAVQKGTWNVPDYVTDLGAAIHLRQTQSRTSTAHKCSILTL